MAGIANGASGSYADPDADSSAPASSIEDPVIEGVETVVVGAGQAGLAMSYHLSDRGREHVVLERGRIGEAWLSERWDSLAFQFPNWTLQLPSYAYEGPDPEGFSPRTDIARFLDDYASSIQAPVRCGARVISVRRDGRRRRFLVETEASTIEATNVVVATGSFHQTRNSGLLCGLTRRRFPTPLDAIPQPRRSRRVAVGPGRVAAPGRSARRPAPWLHRAELVALCGRRDHAGC